MEEVAGFITMPSWEPESALSASRDEQIVDVALPGVSGLEQHDAVLESVVEAEDLGTPLVTGSSAAVPSRESVTARATADHHPSTDGRSPSLTIHDYLGAVLYDRDAVSFERRVVVGGGPGPRNEQEGAQPSVVSYLFRYN
jgi:hypothetical protein